MAPKPRTLAKSDFETLSEFRYQMRRFERFSERAAKAEGLMPQQYLMLLHIKGTPGRAWASVGEIAERLQVQPHAAVALVSRCEALDLVEVHLLARGEDLLQRLAALHRAELKSLDGVFAIPQIHFPELP